MKQSIEITKETSAINVNDEKAQLEWDSYATADVSYPFHFSLLALSCILIPVFGIAFGDAAKLGALTITELYLVASIIPLAMLVVFKCGISKQCNRSSLDWVGACCPMLAASLLSFGVLILDGNDFSANKAIWMISCQLAIAFWLVVTSEVSFSFTYLPVVVPCMAIPTLAAYFISWRIQGFSFPCAGLSVHKNAMGLAALCIFTMSLDNSFRAGNGMVTRSVNALTALMATVVLFATGSRSALFCAVLLCCVAVLFWFFRSMLFMNLVGVVVLLLTIVCPILYIESEGSSMSDDLSEQSEVYTGQEVYNGRQRIWQGLIEEIQKRPVFGHGHIFQVERKDNIPMNAHNLFLGTLFQSGIIGVCGVAFLLINTWFRLARNALLSSSFIYISFLFAVLIRQIFESEITGENHVSMFAIWAVLSVGMVLPSTANQYEVENDDDQNDYENNENQDEEEDDNFQRSEQPRSLVP